MYYDIIKWSVWRSVKYDSPIDRLPMTTFHENPGWRSFLLACKACEDLNDYMLVSVDVSKFGFWQIMIIIIMPILMFTWDSKMPNDCLLSWDSCNTLLTFTYEKYQYRFEGIFPVCGHFLIQRRSDLIFCTFYLSTNLAFSIPLPPPQKH